MRRWLRPMVVIAGAVAGGLVIYFTVQQFRIRPAPKLRIEQVGWVEIRTSETRLLAPRRDATEIAEILSGWNSSRIGPLKGETTQWFFVTIYLRDGRVFHISGGESGESPALTVKGRWLERSAQVYPSERLKAYILRLLEDYEELDR